MTTSRETLSERELQVLEQIALGASNKEIAKRLVISIHTAKTHVRNISRKLEVSSRTEAAMLALQEGWVQLPGASDSSESASQRDGDSPPEPVPSSTASDSTSPPEPVTGDQSVGDDGGADHDRPNRFQKPVRSQADVPSVDTSHSNTFSAAPAETEWPTTTPEHIPDTEPVPQYDFPNSPLPPFLWWHQLYLLGAFLLSLAVASVPFVGQESSQSAVYIPSIRSNSPFATVVPTPAPSAPPNWAFHAPLRTPRESLALVPFEDRLFAIGGILSDNSATSLVELYDPWSNRWQISTPKPSPVARMAGATFNRQVYVPGGCDENLTPLDVLEVYQPDRNEWTTAAPLPEPRCAYGLVSDGQQFYLLGGWNGEDFVDTMLVYQPDSDRWLDGPSKLPRALGFMGAALLDGQLYVAGGFNGTQEFSDVYRFDLQNESWTEVASLSVPHGGLALVASDRYLLAIGGGFDAQDVPSEQYDPTTDTWSPFATPFDSAWRNMGTAVIDTRMYAVGGTGTATEGYKNIVTSYQFIYEIFLPFSSAGD